MSTWGLLQQWWHTRGNDAEAAWQGDMPSWIASLLVHLVILIGLTLLMVTAPVELPEVTVLSSALPEEDPLAVTDDFSYSELPSETIGAASAGMADAALALAPALALDTAQAGLKVDERPESIAPLSVQEEIRLATGENFAENLVVNGAAGVGAVGAGGAIDRITHEILLKLEERHTLVVWLFDQSGSLARQRAEIRERFDRIYDELGVIEASGDPAFAQHDNKPLLSSVVAFGQNVTFLTPKPTDDINEIRSAVDSIATDESGVEHTFQAVIQTVERYRAFRTQQPRRNVMLVIFTDEVGDDEANLDRAVTVARRLEIPIYCVGVPAPFGLRDASIKYVDPDPKYDQTPQWIEVRQGPESYLPELVKIGSREDEPLDSGFGPYSLTRLCYETGGIFFAVHPNRKSGGRVGRGETAVLSAQMSYFFDPEVMNGYRPDYVPIKEYERLLKENRARTALVQAAQLSWIEPIRRPTLTFPKLNDADLVTRLSEAQQAAAVLEPKINQLLEVLATGEKDRAKLNVPRWQAGYDLSMGRVLALKLRTEGYNAMLAKAKQGMSFADPKNDTWRLVSDDEVSVGSAAEKLAAQARAYLQRVVHEHPGTPWAHLAEQELAHPFGWKWEETYTGVSAPPQVADNNNPRAPRDEKAKMLKRRERRPPPKL